MRAESGDHCGRSKRRKRTQLASNAARAGAAFVALYIVTLAAPVARADQALPAAASKALRLGAEAASRQEWTLALQQFQKAFGAAPRSPQVIFDLALVNDKMGANEFAALAWYRAYLAVTPQAANRDVVTRRAAALATAIKASADDLIKKAVAVDERLPVGYRFGALQSIASTQASLGDADAALALVSKASVADLQSYVVQAPQLQASNAAYNRDALYASLAGNFAAAGDLSGAEAAMRRIVGTNQYAHERQTAIENIANALTNAHHFRQAESYANLSKGVYRIAIFQNLADAQKKAGDEAGAKANIGKALAALGQIDPKQYDLNNLRSGLIVSTGSIDGLAAARRLYAQIKWTKKDNADTRDYATEHLVAVLVDNGRIAEAKAVAARMRGNSRPYSGRWAAGQDIARASSAANVEVAPLSQKIGNARSLASLDKYAAELAKFPQSASLNPIKLQLAAAYSGFDDKAKAKRILDALYAHISRTKLTADKTSFEVNIARQYVSIGQKAEADRIERQAAVYPLIASLVKQPYQFTARALAQNFADLANAQKSSGDIQGARASVLKAFIIGSKLKDTNPFLDSICATASAVRVAAKCEAQASRMPAGENRDAVYVAILTGYPRALKPQPAELKKIRALTQKIDNAATRVRTLEPFVDAEITQGDWSGALLLAAGSTELTEDVAMQMIYAGRLQQAQEIEPQFAKDDAAQGRYFYLLGQKFADQGDLPDAFAAAARIRNRSWRIGLRSYIYRDAFDWGGPDVAGKLRALAHDSKGGSADAAMANACAIELQTCGVVTRAAAAEARPSGEERYRLDRDWTASQDGFDSRKLAGAVAAEATYLYSQGAFELADSAFTPSGAHPEAVLSNVWQIVAEDNPGVARVLADAMAAKADLDAKSPNENGAAQTAVDAFLAAGEVDKAMTYLKKIIYRTTYLFELRNVSLEAQAQGLPIVGDLLSREAQIDRIEGYSFYLDELASRAAKLGLHPLAENIRDEYRNLYPKRSRSAEFDYIEGLLEHGDISAAADQLNRLLAQPAQSTPSAQSLQDIVVAKLLAWTGQGDALGKLVKNASGKVQSIAELRAAADGYARAGEPDQARAALREALAEMKIKRADFDGWSGALIAEAQDVADPAAAAKSALAIADPNWRRRAVVSLVQKRFAAGDMKGAVALLQNAADSPIFDGLLARAARYLYGQGDVEQGRAFIRRIADPALRDATLRFSILTQARLALGDDLINQTNEIKSARERTYLLIDLGALYISKKQPEQAAKTLHAALGIIGKISDPLTRADAAVWIARLAGLADSGLARDARAEKSDAVAAIADPAARLAMRELDADLNGRAAILASAAAYAKRVSNEANGFVSGLAYAYPKNLGDDYARSLASQNPQYVPGLLAGAAAHRMDLLKQIDALSQAWSKARPPLGKF